MKEIWKDIHGFEKIYKISNTGKIIHVKTQKIQTGISATLVSVKQILKISIANLVKAHYPELVKKEVLDIIEPISPIPTIGTLVEELPIGAVLEVVEEPFISIKGIEYRSYIEASEKLNLAAATVRRRVSSDKYDDYIKL